MNQKNDEQDFERRTFGVELRATGGEDGATPEIVGMAAVYNRKSEVIFDFQEIIEPGFFDNVLEDDVRALWNHNDDLVLGRTKADTLFIKDAMEGLTVRILPPDTSWGRDALVSIGRKDVNQMSFAFRTKPDGQEWVRTGDGKITRRLLKGGCERLLDVSPVTFPAYPQTSVSVRSKLQELAADGQAATAESEAREQALKALTRRKLELKKLDLI